MPAQPEIQQRPALVYAGIPATVTMDTLPEAADTGFPELFGWLAEHGVAPAGPPPIRYRVIGMAADLEIELAVPVSMSPTWPARTPRGPDRGAGDLSGGAGRMGA